MGGKTQSTTSSQNYTPAALQQLQDIYSKASSAASTPYTPYSGQITAGLTDTQKSGIANVNAAAHSAQPYYDTAAGYAKTGASAIDPSQINRYLNPYTQSVINSTQANFNESNGQQQQQVVGNAALKGALGGDRVGVAQAELARQQKLAQDPVIAGLNQQNYTQALQAAQADRGAAQNGASQFAGLGTGSQNAALQGAGAQLTAGGAEQAANQAGLNAQYQQFLNQQAFPYQQAQFLAGIGLPVAGAMGGTTQGTQTSPGPNPWAQAAGLGLSAAGLFSDERVKDGIEKIGETYDGQPIYRFRYKGEPTVRIGLMAQDVEKKNPKAVGKSRGIKTVDYDKATRVAANKGHFADGGAVNGSPFNFITDSSGYVPKSFAISGGAQTQQPQAMSMPSASSGSSNLDSITKQLGGMKGSLSGMFTGHEMGSPGVTSPLAVIGGSGDYAVPTFMADGGVVNFSDRFTGSPFSLVDEAPIVPDPGLQKVLPESMQAWRDGIDQPNPAMRSDAHSVSPMTATAYPPYPQRLPPQITGPQDQPTLPENAMAYDAPAQNPMSVTAVQNASHPDTGQTMGGWNPFGLSDKARQAIISGGFGVAASRSPFALSAIGEGGQQGMKTYGDLTTAERESADKKITQRQSQQRIDQEARRIAQSAEQFAKTHDVSERRLQKDLDKVPPGYRKTNDGTYEPIPGGPADPTTVERLSKAKRPAGEMDQDTAEFLAERVLVGDTRALVGLGRGAQGAENLARIQSLVAGKAKDRGIDPTDILQNVADQSGNMASQRTFGTNVARMAVNSTEAQGAIELGRTASSAVPRTNWVPVNKAIQAYQSGTSNPALAKFGAANLAIINTYSRAISPTGNPTVNDKQHAEHLLSTATGPDAYNAVLDQMNEEIKIAHAAPTKAKKEMEDIRKGRTPEAAEHAPRTAPPVADRKVGEVYVTPKGRAKWMGNGWQLVQ